MNKYRNEIEVELNGTKYLLRPTFNCLAEIEERLNLSIFQFSALLMSGGLKAKDAAFVLECGIKAADGKVDTKVLHRDMSEGGLNQTIKAIADFLAVALNAGDLAKKN